MYNKICSQTDQSAKETKLWIPMFPCKLVYLDIVHIVNQYANTTSKRCPYYLKKTFVM